MDQDTSVAEPIHPILIIAPEVIGWSRMNFDTQKGLEHLAPLMGLFEELGELTLAQHTSNANDITDAVGDIGIYALDFIGRANLNVADVWPTLIDDTVSHDPVIYLSQMAHCCLKRHQGIRGFDDTEFFYKQLTLVTRQFLTSINNVHDLTTATVVTWKTVSQRNWKKNAKTAT